MHDAVSPMTPRHPKFNYYVQVYIVMPSPYDNSSNECKHGYNAMGYFARIDSFCMVFRVT